MTRDITAAEVAWHISTYSQNADANCVEAGPVLDDSGRVAVRDSTRRGSGTFTIRSRAWSQFTHWTAQRR